MGCSQNIREAEGRDDHEQARADADQHVRAKSGRPYKAFAVGADDAAERGGDKKANNQFPIGQHDPLHLVAGNYSTEFVGIQAFFNAPLRQARRRLQAATVRAKVNRA